MDKIHRVGYNMSLLHQQTLFNRCQFNLSLEVTAFDSTVLCWVMAISVSYMLPIKPTVQYCRDSPWRGKYVYVTLAKVIQQVHV
jgi:hypothetical protein